MNLLRAPLNTITYDMLRASLYAGTRETRQLEYKGEFSQREDSIAKSIASMANTYGGVIVFGVHADVDGTPRLPPAGVEGKGTSPGEALANQVEQVAIDAIVPSVPVEVRAVEIPAGEPSQGRWLVIVRVPESHQAPHLLVSGNELYVRELSQTRRIGFPPLPWIEHLLERRRGPEALREGLWEKSLERLGRSWRGNHPPRTFWAFAVSRVFPRDLQVPEGELLQLLEAHLGGKSVISRINGASLWELNPGFLLENSISPSIHLIDVDTRGYFFEGKSPNIAGAKHPFLKPQHLAELAAWSWSRARAFAPSLGLFGHLQLRVELHGFSGWQIIAPGDSGREPFPEDVVRHDEVVLAQDFADSDAIPVRLLRRLAFGLGHPRVNADWEVEFSTAIQKVGSMPDPRTLPKQPVNM